MDYLEFLNRKAGIDKQTNPFSSERTDNVNENNLYESLFSEEFTVTQKEDGSSVFNLATQEELENIDYEKIVSKEQPEESDTLTSVLRNFLSFDSIKEDADTDGDGEVSAEEAKDYIKKLAAQDGDDTTLSTDDFNIAIETKDIDLEAIAEQLENETSVENSVSTPSVTETPAPDVSTPDISVQQPSQFTTDASTRTSQNYNHGYSHFSDSRPYTQNTTPTNPLDSMSLDELENEKTNRESTVKEKQANVNAVNNGTNDKVKEANEEKLRAEEDYKEALRNDPNISRRTNRNFQRNLESLNETQAQLDENAIKINDKEIEIADQEEIIKTLTSESDSLTSYFEKFNNQLEKLEESLSKVGNPTGRPEDADADAQINAKKQELNSKIAEKRREIEQKKNEIDAKEEEIRNANEKLDTLKKELESFNQEKIKLEEKKNTLESEKTEIETKIQADCTNETKAKMEAYNNAVRNAETVKSSELEKAQTELREAQAAVQEVNTKINQIKNKKVSTVDMNMDNIPAKYRDSVTVRTLPDGTEVLTFKYTNVKDMQPEMRDKIAIFNEVAAEKGYTFVMSDGFRSIEESNRARAQKGNMVAPGGQSPHNYGSAFDCGVYKDGGQPLKREEWTNFAREVQQRSGNITWGGDFANKPYEVWHFELSDWKKYRA